MSDKERSVAEADDLSETSVALHPPLPADEEEASKLLGRLISESAVEEARALVKEFVEQWPDSPRLQHWARVLEPPKGRVIKGPPSLPRDKEYAWLRQHACEYPGQWLALRGDQLVAADANVAKVLEIVNSTGHPEEILLYFQPDPDKLWPQ
jgi:hypothetical protein